MDSEIRTMEEFRIWVAVGLAGRQMSQRKLAYQMHIHYPRISEAVNGKASAKKYLVPIIEALGGDPKNFKTITQ